MKLFLIQTQGQGDLNIDLVTEDVWDVIINGSSADPQNIQATKELYLKYKSPYWTPDEDDWNDFIENTIDSDSSSPVNNRALALKQLRVQSFDSIMYYGKWVLANPNIDVADEWYGYVY